MTGSQNSRVLLWDTENGHLMATLIGHAGWVHDVVFSPDGSQLISAGGGGKIRIWDTRSRREHATARERARALRNEARPIFESLHDSTGNIDETIARLEADSALDPALKESALGLAHARRGTRAELYGRLWRDLTPREGDPLKQSIARGIARGFARASGHRATQDSQAQSVLGIAEYRLEHWQEALDNLERSTSMNAVESPRLLVADLAFSSMTYAKLERFEEAVAALARLEAHLAKHPELRAESRSKLFLEEARLVLQRAKTQEHP